MPAFRSPSSRHALFAASLAVIFIAFLFPATRPLSAAGFSNRGPFGGDIQSLAVDPLTPSTMYAGTSTGGVFKSTDNGASWRPVNNGLPENEVISLLTDPVSPGTVYAGLDGGGLYKSIDGGSTWAAASTGITAPSSIGILALAAHPAQKGHLYAAVYYSGVFKTENGGASWVSFSTGLSEKRVRALVIDQLNPLRLYAGTETGVFRSVDGGLTWGRINNGLTATAIQALALDPASSSTVYAGTNGGVFKSTDGGDHWSITGPGLTTNSVLSLAFTRAGLFAGLWGGGVCRTVDGGLTWIPVFTGAGHTATPPITWSVAAQPGSPDTILAGTFPSGLFRSIDGGETWGRLPLPNTSIAALATDTRAPGCVYAGTISNRLNRSTDGGTTWAASTPSLFEFSADALAVAVDPADSKRIYTGNLLGGISRSTDGGATFSSTGLSAPGSWVHAILIDPTQPQTLYAATDRPGFSKSTNGGATWQSPATAMKGLEVEALAMNPSNPRVLYAGTFGGGVFRSDDGGTNWMAVSTGIPNNNQYISSLLIDPRAPDTVYAGVNGGVYYSNDKGNHWTFHGSGLQYMLVKALAMDPAPEATLFAGVSGWGAGVYRCSGPNQGWSQWNDGIEDLRITALAASPESTGLLYVGTEGAGVYVAELHEKPKQALNLSNRRVSVTVEWKNHYSGQTGTAYAIPQRDEFGFFYFTDPNNPEVFVKVLDFGGAGALCFVGGLSDFYYKVTFKALSTGQTLVFEKPAGQYVGFADNGGLKFNRRESGLDLAPHGAVQTGILPLAHQEVTPAQPEPLADQGLTLSQGRVLVTVDWRNQYSGQSGTAYGIPQKDEFGFFYFTDPGNPEVFVKVLDFGSGGALCFVGGLSDFFYKVTFRLLRTGQTLVFEKNAGLYLGFADNGTLRF